VIDLDCIRYIIEQKQIQREAAKSSAQAEQLRREIKALMGVIEL